jgi:hypothetical protein
MPHKPEIQYIRYYTDGSAARQPEVRPAPRKRTPQPQPQKKRRPKYILRVQPMAVLGVVVSLVMLCMMIGGVSEYFDAQQEARRMENYVSSLHVQNEELREQYEGGLDLVEIEKAALALGMVPEESVRHITVSVPMEQVQPEQPDFWENVNAFLTAMIAY